MINRFIKKHSKNLYIFFLFLSLILFFFSTDKVYAKSFNIENIEVSKPPKLLTAWLIINKVVVLDIFIMMIFIVFNNSIYKSNIYKVIYL